MSNPNKAKGTRHETAVTRYLKDQGILAYKPRPEGHRDIGDIWAPPFVIQAKDWGDLLAGIRAGVEGYQIQRKNAEMPFGVAVVKRARKPIEDAYVVMRLADLPDVIRAVIRGEQD